jgi:hypothetical protein
MKIRHHAKRQQAASYATRYGVVWYRRQGDRYVPLASSICRKLTLEFLSTTPEEDERARDFFCNIQQPVVLL